ncbi:hypothetical protein [Thalassobacillus sp. CUG 92003]|nr:hypothetical protein [Thalassobacillus sp. CUG 92003]
MSRQQNDDYYGFDGDGFISSILLVVFLFLLIFGSVNLSEITNSPYPS